MKAGGKGRGKGRELAEQGERSKWVQKWDRRTVGKGLTYWLLLLADGEDENTTADAGVGAI